MVMVTCPSPAMRTKALKVPAPAGCASPSANVTPRLSIIPPPAAALTFRKWRRDVMRSRIMVASVSALRGVLDRLADADVSTAAADVAGHRRVDVGVGRL